MQTPLPPFPLWVSGKSLPDNRLQSMCSLVQALLCQTVLGSIMGETESCGNWGSGWGEESWGHHWKTAKSSPTTDFNTRGHQDSTTQTHPPQKPEASRAQGPPLSPLCFMVSYALAAILKRRSWERDARLKNQRHSTFTDVTIKLVSGYSYLWTEMLLFPTDHCGNS